MTLIDFQGHFSYFVWK